MAGLDAVLPPLSSDPQTRLWTQIRMLQQRVASLEARRDLIVRETITGTVNVSSPEFPEYVYRYASGTFESSGRELLLIFGPNIAWLNGSTSVTTRFVIDEQFVADSNSAHVADGTSRFDPCPSTGAYIRVPAGVGEHTWRVAAPISSVFLSFDFTALIMELPTL